MNESPVEPNLVKEVEAETVKLESESPVPWPWVKKKFWNEELAVVEVAVMVPASKLPMVEVEKLPKLAWKLVEVALVVVEVIRERAEIEEEALTMMPTVEVGVMAEDPEKVQLEPVPGVLEIRHPPLKAKQPVERLMPLANVEVPAPPTLRMPEVWMLPEVVVAIPTPKPPVMYKEPPIFNLARLP